MTSDAKKLGLALLGGLVAYVVLQLFVLPRLGFQT